MEFHHGAHLLSASAHETPFGPLWRTSACADPLPFAIELIADILPAGVPRIARLCRLVGVLQLAYGRLPSEPHARPGVQGRCATQRQNHERTVTVPLRPGARDRPAGGARSRGRRVPIEGVLLLIVHLAHRRPDDDDRKKQLVVDGTTLPTRPDPVIHTPHESPLDCQ